MQPQEKPSSHAPPYTQPLCSHKQSAPFPLANHPMLARGHRTTSKAFLNVRLGAMDVAKMASRGEMLQGSCAWHKPQRIPGSAGIPVPPKELSEDREWGQDMCSLFACLALPRDAELSGESYSRPSQAVTPESTLAAFQRGLENPIWWLYGQQLCAGSPYRRQEDPTVKPESWGPASLPQHAFNTS